jgi:hypothetical protein
VIANRYEIVTINRLGKEHVRPYTADTELSPGDVIRLGGRDWLVDRIEPGQRVVARPARYRLSLRHPSGHVEVGAFRRWRSDTPRLGHSFTTVEEGVPASWEVVDVQLAHDDEGEPYLELIAERDFLELDELPDVPDHELEHALAQREDELPEGAQATLGRAREAGLSVELVALEPGVAPDWDEARRYIDALTLDLIEDDLIELCGVDPDNDPRDTWLDTVKERLRSDLELFRADIEGDHDEIEEWDFRDGRISAAVGSTDDESNPNSGYGWLVRLVDSGALTLAGFRRVRKTEI